MPTSDLPDINHPDPIMKKWEDLNDAERLMISDAVDEDITKAELAYRTIRHVLAGY